MNCFVLGRRRRLDALYRIEYAMPLRAGHVAVLLKLLGACFGLAHGVGAVAFHDQQGGCPYDGAPSVLFDAVVLFPSEAGARALAVLPAARDFVADAFAHRKFIGCADTAAPLLEKAGTIRDAGVIEFCAPEDAAAFLESCRALRFWERESALKAEIRGKRRGMT
jgi:hypothetical protein